MSIERPIAGQQIRYQGHLYTVLKVHAFGTCDVESASGKCFRISGLGWL